MARSFDEWLNEGEDLYRVAVDEFRELESQIHALQIRLATRRTELAKLSEMLNKQPIQHPGDHPLPGAPVLDDAANEASPLRQPTRNFLGGPLR
jgi:hypothetical protein